MTETWQPSSGHYGLYDDHHLLIHLPGFEAPLLSSPSIDAFVRSHSPEDQEDRAFRDAVTVHEIRHMDDCCGTIAGITLFQAHVTRLISFAQVCARLRNDDLKLQLPLKDWVRESSCPSYVRKFWTELTWGGTTGQLYTGRVSFPLASRPPFAVYSDMEPIPGHRLPVIAIAVEEGDDQKATQPQQPTFFVVPVGFEQLIEGTASALQDAYIDLWPSEIADRVRARFKTEAPRPTQPQTKGFYAYPPYEVTGRLLSTYLSKRGLASYPRDRLVELADRGLMWGSMPTHGATNWRHPGGGFVCAMEEADWTADPQKAATRPRFTRAQLQKFRDALEAKTPAPELLPSRTILDCINYIACFVIRHISLPILDLRLKLGDRLMTHCGTYLRHWAKFPRPPVIVTDTEYLTNPFADGDFERKWIEFVMFSDIAMKIWDSRTRSIDCARAFGQIPGLSAFDLFPPTGCEAKIKAKTCRIWSEGRQLPHCRFALMLKGASLLPFEPNVPMLPVKYRGTALSEHGRRALQGARGLLAERYGRAPGRQMAGCDDEMRY
jgi:hypothetical protein